jgi:hypothetical protein
MAQYQFLLPHESKYANVVIFVSTENSDQMW